MFGGFYNAEALYESVLELKKTYVVCKNDTVFWEELYSFYPYVGRLTPMHFAEHLTEKCGGAKIYLKREDLCHTMACAGGGGNTIGMFHPFIKNKSVRLVSAEAAGDGVDTSRNSATISAGAPGVFHGAKMYLLQDKKGQVMKTRYIVAGLNYPDVAPENLWLKSTDRAEHHAVTDAQALEGFCCLAELEDIIPSLKASHTVCQAMQVASVMTSDELLVIYVSGNDDKDLDTIAEVLPAIDPQIE
ncbi:hypothetical protein IW140_005411 [Coemansia sp. RSA 1813]|nr:hypothetical protein EV178_005369 [Coemansia sp. RSA 1646]KAJ1767737.1 hypothetical protein LPJ74_005211 [Coemansia sp. RSA 1843]KAJ2086824.1 hypothetical protein IW138_005391 [Coemansia sp. RSA 986]KAJ2211588.1 hypothetical protein EV179_005354 [Coemansia sp. RSA 487]KAJ2565200.1 hypothetical protein IW140_005411 [Coemansia sp. RSA 1813]